MLPNVAIPLTKAALQLLDAKNTDETLSKIKLSADSEASGIVNVDLVVVDPEAGWAGAYEIKRGNGATEHGKRRPIMRRLRAVRWCSPPSSTSSATGRSRPRPAR